MPISSVVQILTASIAPVIVISGVGLLLLSISNRYGRALDRARLIMRELQRARPAAPKSVTWRSSCSARISGRAYYGCR
jgi:hypothetical protein